MIVDIHMHLGDILNPRGATIISSNTRMPRGFNIQVFEEKILYFKSYWWTHWIFERYDDFYTKSVQDRIRAGTIGNFQKHYSLLKGLSMELFGDGRVYCACMPVAPNVYYEDLVPWANESTGLLPFTSIDPAASIEENYMTISKQTGAYGLKLHPILQGIPFDSELVFSILNIFEKCRKPVLFHAGASRYYLGEDKIRQFCHLDDIQAAESMVRAFPDIPFVVGHAGIAERELWADALKKYDNVFFDISVQSVSSIKKLINYYGEDKILLGTDWPCVNTKITLKIIKKACTSKQLEKALYLNAAKILNLL